MIRAILFDFDGVLTLDETGSQSICNYICQKTGIDYKLFKNEYRKYNADLLTGRLKHEDVWDKICAGISYQIDMRILHDSFINTPINKKVLDLVLQLKEKNYKIGMVTDNKADRIKSLIDFHLWDTVFDGIAVSANIGSGKEHRKIFNWIFETLTVLPSECIFIDNKKENLIIPQNMGVTTIFFDHSENNITRLINELIAAGISIS